jgi:hypothetical protein
VIGAYAVIYYTEPRYTKDFDVWIDASSDNAKKVYAALREFGAPLAGMRARDFMIQGMVYQIGVAPVRVDVITGFKNLDFTKAWVGKEKTQVDDVSVYIIGMKELIGLKQAASREGDRRDLEALRKSVKKKSKK